MPFLLDTSILSEATKLRPEPRVMKWLDERRQDEVFICAPSLGEIANGVAQLRDSRKKQSLHRWLEAVIDEFAERILPFDTAAAMIWGEAAAAARRSGVTLPILDCQIGAIACAYALTIVTRNVHHFKNPAFERLRIFNPWE